MTPNLANRRLVLGLALVACTFASPLLGAQEGKSFHDALVDPDRDPLEPLDPQFVWNFLTHLTEEIEDAAALLEEESTTVAQADAAGQRLIDLCKKPIGPATIERVHLTQVAAAFERFIAAIDGSSLGERELARVGFSFILAKREGEAAREELARACRRNLKRLGLGLIQYADGNRCVFPPAGPAFLRTLHEEGIVSNLDRFVSPCVSVEAGEEFATDYATWDEHELTSVNVASFGAMIPMVWSASPDPLGGHRNVLFADGHVDGMTETSFRRRMDHLRYWRGFSWSGQSQDALDWIGDRDLHAAAPANTVLDSHHRVEERARSVEPGSDEAIEVVDMLRNDAWDLLSSTKLSRVFRESYRAHLEASDAMTDEARALLERWEEEETTWKTRARESLAQSETLRRR